MPAHPASARPAPNPLKRAARTANGWGWSYILTILGALSAGYVQPGPLRVLLLNFGILCFVIGVLELVWRHQLLKTGQAKWAKVLALNQTCGSVALFWSFYLLYQVPDQILADYSKKSELWNRVWPLIKSMDVTHRITDAYIVHSFHETKIFFIYIAGGITLLSQIWVIRHYLRCAREIEQAPAPLRVPPILK
jgi:hypothetical protein